MNSTDLIRRVQQAGWIEVRHRGSHVQFKHPTLKVLVTIPHPVKDLPKGTAHSILKMAGLL